MGRGMGIGATAAWARGETTGLAMISASPKEEESEGGGTDGYVSSRARGCVPAAAPTESEDAGVVIFVAWLVDPMGGENGKGEGRDAEVDEGGVVGLSEIAFDGR